MTISTVAKVGSGAVFAAGTPASIYFSWDHITLYAVEREVIDTKDLKLTVTGPSTGGNKITIEASKHSGSEEPKLSEGYSWTCEIKVEPREPEGTSDVGLSEKIQKHLPKESAITDVQINNKNLLVRACAKNREIGHSNTTVKGLLNVKRKGDSNQTDFFFEGYPELNFLLKETTNS